MSFDHAAQKILSDVVKIYETLKSYSDRGEVRHQQRDKTDLELSVSFATFFEKPSIFLFEFSTPHPYAPIRHRVTEYAIGTDGNSFYSFLQRPDSKIQLKSMQTLSALVAGATGVSEGSAHTIGALLLPKPKIGGLSLLDLTEPRLNASAKINGVDCYVISAVHLRGTRFEVFIEKDTLLLRKIIRSSGGAGQDAAFVTEETRDNIRLSTPLDHSLFNSQCAEACLAHLQI